MSPNEPRDRSKSASPDNKSAEFESRLAELAHKVETLTETNRQLKRKIFDLYTIFEISRDFNAVLEYQTLLDTFILTSLAQVGALKAAIFLPSEGQDDRYVLARGKGSGGFPDRRHFFKVGSRLLTYLTKLNRPLPTGELMGDMARRGERTILESFHPGLIVPLIYQSRLRGVFLISDKMQGRDFFMEDVEFLSVLGNQISVAIENARLYESEKEATRQLRAAQDKLVSTERLAALGEMSAKVAHEINNPLGIIKNYLHLTVRALADNPQARGYVDVVGQELNRIARIVRELLDFHQPQAPVYEPIDLTKVIDDILILMARQFESKKIEVVKQYGDNIGSIEASVENLKQVFLNLFINAIDAMREGGRLKVEVVRRNGSVRIRIDDTGPGIATEHIGRIFEPFFTTKELGQGTGLGLSVCYGIIKRHNGTIIYNNTDTGGRFTIKLPVEHHDNQND